MLLYEWLIDKFALQSRNKQDGVDVALQRAGEREGGGAEQENAAERRGCMGSAGTARRHQASPRVGLQSRRN